MSDLVAPTVKVTDCPTVLFPPDGWKSIVGVAAGELVVPVAFRDSEEFLSSGLVIAVTLT
jgi:hypothetical protein